uniref:Uncharacterized protein n=1 Tax=Zea mays TaxID=4577 RepID=A0A804LGB4_MAIZE
MKPHATFNFTLNYPIYKLQDRTNELKDQMEAALLLNPYELFASNSRMLQQGEKDRHQVLKDFSKLLDDQEFNTHILSEYLDQFEDSPAPKCSAVVCMKDLSSPCSARPPVDIPVLCCRSESKAVVVLRTICYQNKKDESGWWPRLLKKDLCS